MIKKKILVVEDDLNLGFLLVNFLQDENFDVKLCKNGLEALSYIEKNHYDLCLLDVMMPKLNGFALAKILKEKNIKTPFVFITAKSLKADCINGYQIGAEDYITKPFDEEELLCKIKVILRRQNSDPYADAATLFHLGNYIFDYSRQELSFNEKIHRLTEKENEVLRLLCLNKNKILKREAAVERIYGKADYFLGRSFDVYISRLRKLLKKDPSIEIQNVFKVGFILNIKESISTL